MESHKKASRKEVTPSPEAKALAAKKLPMKTIRVDAVSCSIFAHQRERDGVTTVNYSCGFSRNYKDRNGTWQHVPWFGLDELGALVSCAQQADEYIRSLINAEQDARA